MVPPVSLPRDALASEAAMVKWRLWLLCWCYYGVQRLCAARCERGRGRAGGQLCNVDSVEVADVKKDPNAKRLKRSGRLP